MERRRGAQGSGVEPRRGARDRGRNRAAEPGSGKEPRRGARGSRVGPRSGASGSEVEPLSGALGSERSRTTESLESGRSHAAEPWDLEWSQQVRLGQEQLKHVSAKSAAPPPPPGHPGLLCVYNLPPGESAGLSRAGRWRDQKGLCCTGRGGRVCFSGWVWVPSPREG